MQTHIKVLGILHIVFGAIGVLIGAGFFLFFGGLAGFISLVNSGWEGIFAVPILGLIGSLILVVMLALSVPGIVVGAGLLSHQPWARVCMIVLSVIHMFNFPFGTALGVYGLWALLSPEGTAMFQSRTRYV